MTIESGIENAGVYIDTLDDTYPAGGDDLVEGDNHIRGIKNCILNTFPNVAGAVTPTHTELNLLDDLTAGTVTASKPVVVDANKDASSFRNIGVEGSILDANGNESVTITTTASAVNEITVANAATGNKPAINQTGADDVGIDIEGVELHNGIITTSASVSGFISGITEYIEGDTGVAGLFDVYANVTTATWESVGPTGSSANNIWTDMDNIPANAKFAIIAIHINAYQTSSTSALLYLHGRKTGSSEAAGSIGSSKTALAVAQASFAGSGSTAAQARSLVERRIPLDSSNRFDLYWASGGVSVGAAIDIRLVGWGI